MLVDLGRNDVGRVAQYRHRSRSADVMVDRALQPRDAHHVERHRPAGRRPRRLRRPARPACRPARSPAHRRCGRCRSSTSSSRTAAARTPAPSATSTSPATWTPASPCGRSSCKDSTAYVQAGAGIVADSVPAERIRGNAQQGPRPAEGDRDHRSAAVNEAAPGKVARSVPDREFSSLVDNVET